MPIDLIAPPPTSFDSRGHVDLRGVARLAEHLSRSGVSGVFLCGSTGEGMSLSVGERKEIVEAWADAAPLHDLKTIVQVGANSQQDAIDLARHASGLRVDAISAHAPCYFRPTSVDSLVRFFEPVAGAAADTPFYYYDIPELTGVDLPTQQFLQQAPPSIPSLAGVKYTNPNLARFQECLQTANGRFEVFFGCDEALLAGYALGARSAIGSTYNFMAPVAKRLVHAFDSGDFDLARALQLKVVETVNLLAEFGYLVAAKTAMEIYGIEFGGVREPLQRLSRFQKDDLERRLSAIGFPFASAESTNASNGQSHQPASNPKNHSTVAASGSD